MNSQQLKISFIVLLSMLGALWAYHQYAFPRQREGVLKAFSFVEERCRHSIIYNYEDGQTFECEGVTFKILRYGDIYVTDGKWEDTITENYKGMLQSDLMRTYYLQEIKKLF